MTKPEKKGRKPSRERTPITGSVTGAIEGALEELRGLRDEFREICDNTSENLQNTSLYESRSTTADTLDNFVDDDVPEIPEAADRKCSWIENRHPKVSRANRCANAISALTAARDGLQEYIDENTVDGDEEEDPETKAEELAQIEEAINTIDEWIGQAEGCEWPGMYG